MEQINDKEFGGERPLYARHDLQLNGVTIHAGESALKECSNITAVNCRFEGKYPFWETDGFVVSDCLFTDGARAALWYSRNLLMRNSRVEAPKMFREMQTLKLENVQLTDAQETLWHCSDVSLCNVQVANADYLFMHSSGISISNYKQDGNYSFQYCHDVEIRNAVINSKDAFWNTDHVTVYDSTLSGEYLGWYSSNLRLVNCHISGTQPLCYAQNVTLVNCTMDEDADLAFEYSSVNASLLGKVHSVKNPTSGVIVADSFGEVILDGNVKAPANCSIETRKAKGGTDEVQL